MPLKKKATPKLVLFMFLGLVVGVAIAAPSVLYMTRHSYELFGIETKQFATAMLFSMWGVLVLVQLIKAIRKYRKPKLLQKL